MKNEIEYSEVNGYKFPNLRVENNENFALSFYGKLKLKYLKEKDYGYYFKLLSENKLDNYLKKIDMEANDLYERLF